MSPGRVVIVVAMFTVMLISTTLARVLASTSSGNDTLVRRVLAETQLLCKIIVSFVTKLHAFFNHGLITSVKE